MKGVYRWVPVQDWNQDWTDEELYKKYGITTDEIAFINSMIRPMADTDD
jgi:site-specific DNA-methyltransferase (adenine-specific)